MILLLATRFQRAIAGFCFLLFYLGLVLPGRAAGYLAYTPRVFYSGYSSSRSLQHAPAFSEPNHLSTDFSNKADIDHSVFHKTGAATKKESIGGPGQPEMSSFTSVGADNMVNLFTGDFNYNIPLLDVGGYPVNLFYNAGIGMEQEASWVGLGWNINPGTVSRNMRGVPDDFNGEDQLVQYNALKPNKTWGVELGADYEYAGIKDLMDQSVGGSIGISFNNYLGPALDLGFRRSMMFKVSQKVFSEKAGADDSIKLKLSVGANLNSRYGLTLSPSVSLTASNFRNDRAMTNGLYLSTSYNSRTGLKSLNISEQSAFNKYQAGSSHARRDFTSSLSTSISFAKPSYVPSLRVPMNNEAYSGHFQVGAGIFAAYVSAEMEVYKQTSRNAYSSITKPMVGYLYYQKANDNGNAVYDFTRFNDREVTSSTPIISAPQYSYDVYAIQGEGTGGSIRLYRNDLGTVHDNFTSSQDNSLNIGADIGVPGHFGANVSIIKTPTTISEWMAGNKLRSTIPFRDAKGIQENVYFRNPGENSVLNPNQFKNIGGTDLVRFQLGNTGSAPTIEPILERFSKTGKYVGAENVSLPDQQERRKRTQVVNYLTAAEASDIGLERSIRSYDGQSILNDTLIYESIDRVGAFRKAHHISEIDVTEANGRRYVYGIPVYNTIQKDFSFSVGHVPDPATNLVQVDAGENTTASSHINGDTKRDGYVQVTETPAYAHSFLLTGLLSPDYVDVTGNGITEDDLGEAVKFNYTKIKNGADDVHKWRTPLTKGNNLAAFNDGNRSERRDDKALITYGERESWYLHSVESKSMIALFSLENREDGKGTVNELGGVNTAENMLKRLKQIDLYNKADLKKNGLAGAKPVKTVHFVYSYALCANSPENSERNVDGNGVLNGSPNVNANRGKLTLEKIYFTFNGQNKASRNQYVFNYGNTQSGTTDNPDYVVNASDRWGTYKPSGQNPNQNSNIDFPYADQDAQHKTAIDQNAAAWSLKKVLLPSGGQIEVTYESDDYAFVQNKRAAGMMSIMGFGNSPSSFITNRLYTVSLNGSGENDHVFIHVPEACASKAEVFQKYLSGVEQLAFKLMVYMPRGPEMVPCYAAIKDYGVDASDHNKIWVQVEKVDNYLTPMTLSALEYLREQLPGQAFEGYDVSDGSTLEQVGNMLLGMLQSLRNAFTDPVNALRNDGKAQSVELLQSFVRLNRPDGIKYGGGHRVKSVILKDNWSQMSNQYTSYYGQEYDYTTKEVVGGVERTISSGVASYEPSIGGDENPFHTIVRVANTLPLGPTSYGAVEMPVLDAFFPAPSVGYSKVTVRSVSKGKYDASVKQARSGIGRQVTEFYTAKDYPVYYSHTSFDPGSDKQSHQSSVMAFFYKYGYDSRALSQGFLVATNDMHGKIKAQASYPENDPNTPVNYTQHYYRNTGEKGLDETFDFVYGKRGGVIEPGNMGVDVELMTDTREFAVKSHSLEIQAQADLFPLFFPLVVSFHMAGFR